MLADLPWSAVVTPCLIAREARWVTAQYGQEETIELFFLFSFSLFQYFEPLRAIISRCHDEAVRAISHPALDERGVDAESGGSSGANRASGLIEGHFGGRRSGKIAQLPCRDCGTRMGGYDDMRGPPSTTEKNVRYYYGSPSTRRRVGWGKPTVVNVFVVSYDPICRAPGRIGGK